MAAWLSASSTHKPPDDDHHHHSSLHRDMLNGLLKAPSRPHTPLSVKLRQLNAAAQHPQLHHATTDPEPTIEEDPQVARFRALYEESEAKIASLFTKTGDLIVPDRSSKPHVDDPVAPDPSSESSLPTAKKRKLDDDYDDYDDDDDDEDDDGNETADSTASPLKNKSSKVQIIANGTASPIARPVLPLSRPASDTSTSLKQKEKPEDARKKLEEAKRLEQETVLNMSRTLFFTLENDRDAMLDQQRLDEAERRAEAEAEGHAKGQNAAAQQGSLSQSNLGASSLTLKNLIARIDHRRAAVHASDTELRALMSEVRKNRSKWASEDKVGQEELYEAAEKVLNELKAQTEHSGPFLQPVKKKDAPDYFQVIKLPMDLGTMTKKLKQLAYKSKDDFVNDLHLIWTNCLKYNSALDHPMRKHALFMRKETDKLVPLIPDVTIRDRAEVEAEERRQRIANGELDDNAEESDDEPIMASRGRKAPAKSAVKQPKPERQSTVGESTPNPESKPFLAQLNSLTNGIRPESEADAASQGHSTPPPGIFTPTGVDRGASSVIDGGSEIPDSEVPGLNLPGTPPEIEDEEYQLWKQKTKKERAQVAAARHKLFRGDKLNPDEEALLRSKSRMRRWQHMQPNAFGTLSLADAENSKPQAPAGATLAEGLEPEEESMLPDYYDPLAAIPDLDPRLRWEQDAEGNVIDQDDRFLRLYPSKNFVAPEGKSQKKMAGNMQQIQETRKIVSKIGVVKQMSLQTQIYQNQFTRYEPAPFHENDIQPHVMTDEGPLMAPWVAKAALTRSIGEIFFHAGFEEFQPAAIDAMADMAADFFQRLTSTLSAYLTAAQVPVHATTAVPATAAYTPPTFVAPVTTEEALLHTLHSTGLSLPDLHAYITEDLDRTSTRLSTMYERMRSHYADLLRPAVTDETAQGQGSFDSGEQYVAGDFADDLGEDFFGFRELGLDKEFGLVNMTVPLHLLQNRLNTAAATQQGNEGDGAEKLFTPPPPFARVNVENVEEQIGLVREYFKRRLRENGDKPLPEDADLPLKQRKGHGRPRIPATGKIESKIGGAGTSPSKKPPPSASKNSASAMVRNGSTSGPSGTNAKKKGGEPNGLSAPKLEATQSSTGQDGNSAAPADADAPGSPQTNGILPETGSEQETNINTKDKKQNKTPTKPPLKSKTSLNSSKKDKAKPVTNGDVSMVNGVNSPTAPDSTPVKDKKDGEGAMISPESL